MPRVFPTCLATCLASALFATHSPANALSKRLSTTQLKQRLAEIDSELDDLARYHPRSGTGSIGYRSPPHPDPDQLEWVQVELEQPTPIDQIVLVPAIWRDTESHFKDDGFPEEFRIVAGTEKAPDGTLIASFSKEDHLLPRIAPLVVPCSTTASWVRIEATTLSPGQFDGRFNLELAELLIFSGEDNVAINRPVTISSPERYHQIYAHLGRRMEFLVDGFMPYQMDTGQGEKTMAYLNGASQNLAPTITIDLKAEHPISRIHLHALEQNDTAPQSMPSGFGFPEHLIVEGALEADFSDAMPLTEYRNASIYDVGPILMHRFPSTPCRYVRLTIPGPYFFEEGENSWRKVGFAEIELFSMGENVALGKSVTTEHLHTIRANSLLTDGSNFFGRILSTRAWMGQLARRHELENERPLVASALSLRYTRQQTNLRRFQWLATLLGAGTLIIILVDRNIRHRAIHRTRERIAADLHDELGANLHAIGLLSDFVRREKDNPALLDTLMTRMRSLTERTAASAKYCTNMLEAEGLYDDLVADMRRAATRLTTDHSHDLSFEGETWLRNFRPRKRIDLFLFYKECLINIIRHAEATQIHTQLIADEKNICLTIRDNGHGLNGKAPSSLKRRARLMGGHLTLESPENGGTRVTLQLKTRHSTRRSS